MSGENEREDLAEALKRPATGSDADMGFGGKPEGSTPEGSPDAAVDRAAAGWSGRREGGTADPDADTGNRGDG